MLPFAEWFPGPFQILPGVDSLEQRPLLAVGSIIKHRNRNIAIMRCPACRSMQFFAVEVSGTDEAPTFSKPVRCSATCRDCEVSFRIVGGRCVQTEPAPRLERKLPDSMKGRLHPPPRVG